LKERSKEGKRRVKKGRKEVKKEYNYRNRHRKKEMGPNGRKGKMKQRK
jgi:hypothetical protein